MIDTLSVKMNEPEVCGPILSFVSGPLKGNIKGENVEVYKSGDTESDDYEVTVTWMLVLYPDVEPL